MTDYPEELDTDDVEELAAYIERRYPTEELRMCDTETIHFAYWDVSHRSVSSEFLDHIQQAGYRVLHAGKATVPRRGTQRAWVECRKHESDTNTDGEEHKEFILTCRKCENEYTPDEAGTILISGPGTAYYTCPRCGHGTNSLPPFPSNE
jgi:DNA-directed RNA polymerase subunit RPC12/RpoP